MRPAYNDLIDSFKRCRYSSDRAGRRCGPGHGPNGLIFLPSLHSTSSVRVLVQLSRCSWETETFLIPRRFLIAFSGPCDVASVNQLFFDHLHQMCWVVVRWGCWRAHQRRRIMNLSFKFPPTLCARARHGEEQTRRPAGLADCDRGVGSFIMITHRSVSFSTRNHLRKK